MAQEKKLTYPIAAVIRTLQVLKLFDREHKQMSLTEISQRAGVSKSSILRVLDSLEAEGFVRRSPETKNYMLGLELFRLSSNGYEFEDFKNFIYPFVKAMVDEIGLMAHVGIIEDNQVLVISKIWPQNRNDAMGMVSVVGGVTPMHCTGVGKVLLAFSGPEVRNTMLEKCRFEAYTPKTITSRPALEAELDCIREQGYGQNQGEHETYLRCTTYPIFSARGNLLGAISLTGLEQIVRDIDPQTIHVALQKVVGQIREETHRFEL